MNIDWDAATWIALAALVISIIVGVRQHLAGGRANLTAEWEDRENVVVTNHGPGPAKNVEVHISDVLDRAASPVPHFGVYQSMRFRVLRAFGAELPNAEMTWRDNRFRTQKVTVVLGDPPPSRAKAPAAPKSNIEAELRAIARSEAAAEIYSQARKAALNRRSY